MLFPTDLAAEEWNTCSTRRYLVGRIMAVVNKERINA
jgi:hypothetical protein